MDQGSHNYLLFVTDDGWLVKIWVLIYQWVKRNYARGLWGSILSRGWLGTSCGSGALWVVFGVLSCYECPFFPEVLY